VTATLVLVHPIGNDVRCWEHPGLTEGVAIEYPGHGDRPRRAGWTQEEIVDEIVGSVDGPIDLVGLSMGSTIVLKTVVRHPDKVRSAVVACSGSASRTAMSPEEAERRRRQILARGELAVEHGIEAVVDETMQRWFTPEALRDDHPGAAYARETILRMAPDAWYDVWACNANAASLSEDELAAIEVPLTAIGGTRDNSGLAGLAKLHEVVHRSRFEILEGPHMMHLEQPDSFRAAVDRHFAWLETGAERAPAAAETL
jgi:pimeloyl-ACP methyl ester carboxylesterase